MKRQWSHRELVEMEEGRWRLLCLSLGALEHPWAWGIFGLNLNTIDGKGAVPPRWSIHEDYSIPALVLEWEPSE